MNENAIAYAKKYMSLDLNEADLEFLQMIVKHRAVMMEDRSVSKETKDDITINFQGF